MPAAKGKMIDINPNRTMLPAATRARVQTYAGAAALKAYRYPKGVSGNPSGMNRYYFECRKLAKEACRPPYSSISSPKRPDVLRKWLSVLFPRASGLACGDDLL